MVLWVVFHLLELRLFEDEYEQRKREMAVQLEAASTIPELY
ncbi:MAG TPA: hypothetical protein VE242_08570 [Chthoniobacterales bacterium]|nr:hypothetical protein [Chthoniobacterales bacterium]